MLESSLELPFILVKIVRVDEIVIVFGEDVVLTRRFCREPVDLRVAEMHGVVRFASEVRTDFKPETRRRLTVAKSAGGSVTKDGAVVARQNDGGILRRNDAQNIKEHGMLEPGTCQVAERGFIRCKLL